jgi:hypothetical protein
MRNVILTIVFLIFTFFINVIFFYASSDYRDFLQNFKNEKILVLKNDEKEIINDDFIEKDENLTIITPSNKNEEVFVQNENDIVEVK